MDEITAASDNKPREHTPLRGPTVTLYRTGVTEGVVTEEFEDGTVVTRTFYTYRELRFIDGEYDLVRQGQLPTGADSWTADLRRIERSGLYDDADVCIARANDHIAAGDNAQAWTDYVANVRAYKMAVRATASLPTFPEAVEYPAMPDSPN